MSLDKAHPLQVLPLHPLPHMQSWSLDEAHPLRVVTQEIAELKLPDLNALTVEPAMRIIEGTAKNMGITVVD